MSTPESKLKAHRAGRRALVRGALLSLLALGAGCSDASSTSPNADTSASLEIAYVRYSRDATSPDLYRMSADGRVSRIVAALPGDEFLPTWSADGRKFAFLRPQSSNLPCGGLWVMNTDGTSLQQIANDLLPGQCGTSWSPDGAQLAFSSFTKGIGIMNADGSNVRWLPGTAYAQLTVAAWSPDGRRIAFASDGPLANGEIRVVDVDGSNPRVLASSAMVANPSWSPDGSQIAFTLKETADDTPHIAVVDSSGSGKHYVTPGQGDWMPAWSPDGRFIVYEHAVGLGLYHIYKVPVAGGSPVDLTPNDSSAHSPMWRRAVGSSN